MSSTGPSDLDRRAGVHAALGDPLRLAIVDELVCSDRSPSDLARRLDLAGNLLAHHLEVLETAGVVRRLRSSGDRRRRYVRLEHRVLADVFEPVLPASREVSPRSMLFVCTHNSARSQLAAALWRQRAGGAVDSAGTHPAERVHPGAVRAARRAGLSLDGARPRLVAPGELLGDAATVVVTVCDRAHEELPAGASSWHWSVPDPVVGGADADFDATLSELDDRIRAIT